eukprot:2639906-Prymnesium_polylepis.1
MAASEATLPRGGLVVAIGKAPVAPASYLKRLMDLPCSWTDLLMWAALIGKQDLAHTFWRKSETPLRDALQAARLCRRLSVSKGGADEEPLNAAADAYEKWASGILDCVQSRKQAVRILCASPKEWENSPIEEAISVERGEQACLDFLVHRQCQYVADMVFCGNYEGSNATIPRSSSMLFVLLQAFCPMLPGFFLTVTTPAFGRQRPTPSTNNSPATVQPERSAEEDDESGSSDDDESQNGPSTIDSLIDGDIPFVGVAQSVKQSAPHMFALYTIPKVKVAVHTSAYMCYIGLLVAVVMQPTKDAGGNFPTMLSQPEVWFYLVTVTRFVEELWQMYLRGFRSYFTSIWNVVDFSIAVLVFFVFALRVITLPRNENGELRLLTSPGLPH